MNEKLHKALGIFLEAMRPFVVGVLQRNFPSEQWEGVFFARLSPDKQRTWNQGLNSIRELNIPLESLIDINNLFPVSLSLREQWLNEFGDIKDVEMFIHCLNKLRNIRNLLVNSYPIDDINDAFLTMKLVSKIAKLPKLTEDIDFLMRK